MRYSETRAKNLMQRDWNQTNKELQNRFRIHPIINYLPIILITLFVIAVPLPFILDMVKK